MHSSKPEENELPYWNAVLLFSIGIEVSRHNPKPTILVINSKPIIKKIVFNYNKFFFFFYYDDLLLLLLLLNHDNKRVGICNNDASDIP